MAKISIEEVKARLMKRDDDNNKVVRDEDMITESAGNEDDDVEFVESVDDNLFIFKLNGSYILSPADDTLNPIIGEFDEMPKDKSMPPCFKDWIDTYSKEINYFQDNEEELVAEGCCDVDDETFADEAPEMVDLGLSVNWAKTNIGASKPEEFGGYYAWGETETKETYTIAKYKYYTPETVTLKTKFPTSIAKTEYDVAYAYDKALCMPTMTQLKELASKCTFTATTVDDVAGFEVKGPNGNTIFIPNSGYKVTGNNYVGTRIYLWSATNGSTLYSQNLMVSNTKTKNTENSRKRAGMCVRPIASGEGEPKTCKLVDLGLSVKWADMNVGAKKSTDYGTRVSWGELKEKTSYDWKDYTTHATYTPAIYTSLGADITKDAEYDVAYKLNKNICMPTKAQFEELIKKCTWTQVTVNDVKGWEVKGPNGNSIFLPINGCYSESSKNNYPTSTYYWTSTDYTYQPYQACTLKVTADGTKSIYAMYRRTGAGIRAVSAVENKNAKKLINPLIPFKWSQSAPYYNLLPKDPATGKMVVTGCTQTALAMIVAYYGCIGVNGKKYRRGCSKITSYVSKKGTKSELTLPELPALPMFDYDNMNFVKAADFKTAESKKAVAQLMQYLGYADRASYSSGGTGASPNNAMATARDKLHLGASPKLIYASSGVEEFKEQIYQELVQGYPVHFSGWNSQGKSGHAFICDGYNPTSDKFHFNWGWGGSYDGWFDITILKPTSSSDYSYSKRCIVGLHPDYIFGDIDKDNDVTIQDLVTLVQAIVDKKKYDYKMDIDSDGKVDMNDIVELVNYIMKKK